MGKNHIPTASEVRDYLKKEEEWLKDCLDNHKTYVITGPKFPGETIWRSKITLPLLEAAEQVGATNEEIWELCKQISKASHAPVTLKEYQKMCPFAEKEKTVDTVLKLLETFIPPFGEKYWNNFDITGYYYCLALISLSDYRKEDCEARLWKTIEQFAEGDPELEKIPTLLRNMKVLGGQRATLKEMQKKIEEIVKSKK
ncbi:MAG: hypothetical protein K6F51_13955 [Acetatifactor sp.]|nr:hypothetical protein [Acetatifactor sp.]